jgi:hypothetical protein
MASSGVQETVRVVRGTNRAGSGWTTTAADLESLEAKRGANKTKQKRKAGPVTSLTIKSDDACNLR